MKTNVYNVTTNPQRILNLTLAWSLFIRFDLHQLS